MAGHTLLTGGAGFIGSTLARHLLAAGHRLVVLDKLTYAGNRENLHGLDLELVVGDVCDKDLVQELLAGAEVVIHAAAESHVTRSHQNAAPFIRSNIEGSRVVIFARHFARNARDARLRGDFRVSARVRDSRHQTIVVIAAFAVAVVAVLFAANGRHRDAQ